MRHSRAVLCVGVAGISMVTYADEGRISTRKRSLTVVAVSLVLDVIDLSTIENSKTDGLGDESTTERRKSRRDSFVARPQFLKLTERNSSFF